MVSQINGPPQGTITGIDSGRSPAQERPAPQNAPAGTASPGDRVSLTEQAGQLHALEIAIRGLPAVDQARVFEMQQAVNSGQYVVDARSTADKFLRFEAQLPTVN